VELNLKTHVPSHMLIAGHRVLISYDGQPLTCYNCNEQGHPYIEYPYRRSPTPSNTSIRAASWSHIVKHGTRQQTHEGERDVTYETDEHGTKPAAKDFSPSGGIVDKHSLCDFTQRPTTENTQHSGGKVYSTTGING
jgi:hypothetical protein